MGSVREIVADYIARCRAGVELEMSFYGQRPSLKEAIRVGANAIRVDGKRHDHQRRIPAASLSELGRRLETEEPQIRSCQSFRHLHELIKSTAMGIPKIGKLTVYDTAVRIGAKVGLAPQDVYLHAGTTKGVAAFRIDTSAEFIEPAELSCEFQKLKPFEIEDVLCIYKKDFHRLAQGGKL